jgi:hypothetical protein
VDSPAPGAFGFLISLVYQPTVCSTSLTFSLSTSYPLPGSFNLFTSDVDSLSFLKTLQYTADNRAWWELPRFVFRYRKGANDTKAILGVAYGLDRSPNLASFIEQFYVNGWHNPPVHPILGRKVVPCFIQ